MDYVKMFFFQCHRIRDSRNFQPKKGLTKRQKCGMMLMVQTNIRGGKIKNAYGGKYKKGCSRAYTS